MSFKEKQSIAMKEVWKNPEFRDKMYENNPILRGDRVGNLNPMYGRGEEFSGVNNPMYGKKHTEESKQKMSLSHQNMSQETRDRIADSRRGRVWINDGIKCKSVKKEELQSFLDAGWVRGRT